jgi:hypothetical protein
MINGKLHVKNAEARLYVNMRSERIGVKIAADLLIANMINIKNDAKNAEGQLTVNTIK